MFSLCFDRLDITLLIMINSNWLCLRLQTKVHVYAKGYGLDQRHAVVIQTIQNKQSKYFDL